MRSFHFLSINVTHTYLLILNPKGFLRQNCPKHAALINFPTLQQQQQNQLNSPWEDSAKDGAGGSTWEMHLPVLELKPSRLNPLGAFLNFFNLLWPSKDRHKAIYTLVEKNLYTTVQIFILQEISFWDLIRETTVIITRICAVSTEVWFHIDCPCKWHPFSALVAMF